MAVEAQDLNDKAETSGFTQAERIQYGLRGKSEAEPQVDAPTAQAAADANEAAQKARESIASTPGVAPEASTSPETVQPQEPEPTKSSFLAKIFNGFKK